MANSTVTTKSTGDNLEAAEVNNLVASINSKTDSLTGMYQVATRSFPCTDLNAYTKQMSISRHTAKDNIIALDIEIANWYVGNDNRVANVGAPSTVTATIEYPVGSFTQIKFDNSVSGICGDGLNLRSDLTSVTIPIGSVFYVRIFIQNSVGIIGSTVFYDSNFDCYDYGNSISDRTMGGSVPKSAALVYTPISIRGLTAKPSVLIIGDSRSNGYGATILDYSGAKGNTQPSIDVFAGFINTGASGQDMGNVLNFNQKIIDLSENVTHVLIQMGINDAIQGITAEQILSNISTFRSRLSNKKLLICTIEPKSVDAATVNTAVNSIITEVNKTIRGGVTGFLSYFDISDIVSTARDSGLWKTGFTSDFLHANNTGWLAIKNSNIINPALF